MKSTYEISVWEDVQVGSTAELEERKICVIGSNTMESQSRAVEPKLSRSINGTTTFSFKMPLRYIDTKTGEKVTNPYLNLLVNERKLKVKWEDNWYDFLVKSCVEDTTSHFNTYTCTDLWTNELSKTGFDLEFDTELENNIGTIEELAQTVIDGTNWRLGDMDTLLQETEEPVYEITTLAAFTAYNKSNTATTIPASSKILLYYSVNTAKDADGETFCQFLYGDGEEFKTDVNDMLVTNGTCYYCNVIWENNSVSGANAKIGDTIIFTLNTNVSRNYRATRLVRQQKNVYSALAERYVNVFTKTTAEDVYEYETTEYKTPTTVVNLVSNPSNFSNTEGWLSNGTLQFKLYPEFTSSIVVSEYNPTSYLYLPPNTNNYNTAISSNRTYISDGFAQGETYVFRIKGRVGDALGPSATELGSSHLNSFTPSISYRNSEHQPTTALTTIATRTYNDGWLEYELQVPNSISYSEMVSTTNPMGLFLTVESSIGNGAWIEEAQFFIKKMGYTSYSSTTETRIDPGSLSMQGIVKTVYVYFAANATGSSPEDIEPLYRDTNPWSAVTPVYNGFEESRTITVKQSNRFNILQTLAETFQCWLKINVEHDSNGYIVSDTTGPKKFISFVKEVGTETGVSFEYGIDLKSINRTTKSDQLATKVIVLANSNEHATNKFCTIARAASNPTKDTAIYNFDYYINQGLISRNVLYEDLYGVDTTSGYLNYYKNLKQYNTDYDTLSEEASKLETAKVQLEANLAVYENYHVAAEEELNNIVQDMLDLTGATSYDGTSGYIVTTVQPDDWNSAWYRYYKVDSTVTSGYKSLLEAQKPTWTENTYYSRSYSGTYTLTTYEPGDWDESWIKYYTYNSSTETYTKLVDGARVTWAANMYYLGAISVLEYMKNLKATNSNQFVKLESLLNDRTVAKTQVDSYAAAETSVKNSLTAQTARLAEIAADQEEILEDIEELNQSFFEKYSAYIQEGTWQNEEYIDDELYYLDALQTAYTSSRPQVQYSLSIIRLDAFEQFKAKKINIGDIAYVIDREFFGYQSDGVTPYKEQVLVSEMTQYFDQPEKDEVKIQNYKTRFDDLFQRIAAATQSLQYSSGEYARAANAITYDGTIESSVIQDTFDSNVDLMLSAQNESVVWDETGITVTDFNDATKRLRITSGGVFVSADGGESWKNAVRGDGISTDLLTAGAINTEQISLYKASSPAYRFDGNGLTAYALNPNTYAVNTKKFVRFDQFGLYGYEGDDDFVPTEEDDIWTNEDTKFALTWKGFFLQGGDGTGRITLSDGGKMSDGTLGLTVKENNNDRVTVGRFVNEDGQTIYGINIKNAEGDTVLTTTAEGDLSIAGLFDAAGGTIGGWTITSGSMSYTLLGASEITQSVWDASWYDYYEQTSSGKYKKLLVSKKPSWDDVTGKVYQFSGVQLVEVTTKPSDWDGNWYNYYYKENASATAVKFLEKEKPATWTTYYKGTSSGKIYRGVPGTGNYQELGESGININNVFTVEPNGEVTATNGTIGGWKLASDCLYHGTAGTTGYQYLGSRGIEINDQFKVDNQGNMTICSSLTSRGYELLSAQPSDWSTNWLTYYIKDGSDYKSLLDNNVPDWEENTYYVNEGTASTPIWTLLTEEPVIWATRWPYYYKLVGSDYKQLKETNVPTFALNTYYKVNSKGIYIKNDGSIYIGGEDAASANFYVTSNGYLKAQGIIGLYVGSGSNTISIDSNSNSLWLGTNTTTNINPTFG